MDGKNAKSTPLHNLQYIYGMQMVRYPNLRVPSCNSQPWECQGWANKMHVCAVAHTKSKHGTQPPTCLNPSSLYRSENEQGYVMGLHSVVPLANGNIGKVFFLRKGKTQ